MLWQSRAKATRLKIRALESPDLTLLIESKTRVCQVGLPEGLFNASVGILSGSVSTPGVPDDYSAWHCESNGEGQLVLDVCYREPSGPELVVEVRIHLNHDGWTFVSRQKDPLSETRYFGPPKEVRVVV